MIMAKLWTLKSIISVRYGFILSFIDDNGDKKLYITYQKNHEYIKIK